MPVALRLFLPEAWTSDPERCVLAGVPKAATMPQSKREIALGELDRLQTVGLHFGRVLADAGYGVSAAFRRLRLPADPAPRRVSPDGAGGK